MLFWKTIIDHYQEHMKHKDRMCVYSSEFPNFKAQGTFSTHCVLTKYMMQGRP